MSFLFFFNDPATTEIYPLPLHDALPICLRRHAAVEAVDRELQVLLIGLDRVVQHRLHDTIEAYQKNLRSEEHTSELQSHLNLVCRLLLEKKKTKHISTITINLLAHENNR